MAGKIFVGIGGWTFKPWRGTFYPDKLNQKRELEYASEHLTSIEVNGTFYGAQEPETFAKWHDETPDDFVFSLKASRYATNRKVLAEAGESVERFVTGGMLELKNKLGPINWQFRNTKKFEPDDFEAFLKLLPHSHEGRALRHVVEVRHESFCVPEFVAMAREHGVAVVIDADSEYPQIADPTASFIYARIMGASEKEPLGYSEADLDSLGEAGERLGRREDAGKAEHRRAGGRERAARSVSLFYKRRQGPQSCRRDGIDRAALSHAALRPSTPGRAPIDSSA